MRLRQEATYHHENIGKAALAANVFGEIRKGQGVITASTGKIMN